MKLSIRQLALYTNIYQAVSFQLMSSNKHAMSLILVCVYDITCCKSIHQTESPVNTFSTHCSSTSLRPVAFFHLPAPNRSIIVENPSLGQLTFSQLFSCQSPLRALLQKVQFRAVFIKLLRKISHPSENLKYIFLIYFQLHFNETFHAYEKQRFLLACKVSFK